MHVFAQCYIVGTSDSTTSKFRSKDTQLSLPRLGGGPSQHSSIPLAPNRTRECEKSASEKEKSFSSFTFYRWPTAIAHNRHLTLLATRSDNQRYPTLICALRSCSAHNSFFFLVSCLRIPLPPNGFRAYVLLVTTDDTTVTFT